MKKFIDETSVEIKNFGAKNRGYLYEQTLHNTREKVFTDLWEIENKPCAGLNQGQGLLQNLFFAGCHTILKINFRDRYIAATVIQWLATNCGLSFLETALKKCGYSINYFDASEPENNLSLYLNRQKQWSSKTFGKSKRTLGIVKHIRKELREIINKPDDLTEWMDVVILALDGYWRHGGEPGRIMEYLQKKQNVNFNRKYPFPISDNEPSEHIKEIA